MGGPEMAPQTPHSLVAPRGTRGAPRSLARSVVAPWGKPGARLDHWPARSSRPGENPWRASITATFYIYTRLPGLIAWLPVLQSGHDSGGHVVADTVARAIRFTSNAAAPPLRSIREPTPTTAPPLARTHSTTSRVEPPVVMTSSTTRQRSPGVS